MEAADQVAVAPRRRHSVDPARPGRTPLLVLLGRVTLALIPLLWIVAYATRPIWLDAPRVDGGIPDHPLANTYMAITLAIGFASPFLLLPFGTAADATVRPDGVLELITVLGRRCVDLRRLDRIGALRINGRAGRDSFILVLRTEGHWAFVSLGSVPHVPAAIQRRLDQAAALGPDIVTARARAMLGIGARPSLTRRVALGTFSVVAGYAVLGVWTLVAMTLIGVVWLPLG